LLGGVTKPPPKLAFARGQVLAAARRVVLAAAESPSPIYLIDQACEINLKVLRARNFI
jgi:hypothetical protein